MLWRDCANVKVRLSLRWSPFYRYMADVISSILAKSLHALFIICLLTTELIFIPALISLE